MTLALELVAPSSCPGLLELAAVGVARLSPGAAIGHWLTLAHYASAALALALIAYAARIVSASWPAAVATTLSVAFAPVFVLKLAPPAAASLSIAAATTLALLALARAPIDRGNRLRPLACLGLALTAAAAPRLSLPLALIAGWVGAYTTAVAGPARRALLGAIAASMVIAVVALVQFGLPSLSYLPGTAATPTACVWPGPSTGAAARLVRVAGDALTAQGPLVIGLAALGVFSLRTRLRNAHAVPLVAYAVAPLALAMWPDADADRTLAPTLVAGWTLAATGLAETLSVCGTALSGRLAAALLLLVLPGLAIARPATRDTPAHLALGHESLSLRDVRTLVAALPPPRVLVTEDAATDVLLRALRAGRTTIEFAMVSRGSSDIAAVLQSPPGRVVALPDGQRDLQYVGFVVTDANVAGTSGLAEVTLGDGCRLVASEWRDVTRPADRSKLALALVARHDRDDASTLIYVLSDRALDPTPIDWPQPATRGFWKATYRGSREDDRERLRADASADDLPGGNDIFTAPFVARLEVWRVPGAPVILPIDFGAPAVHVFVRERSPRPDVKRKATICPALPYSPERVAVLQKR